MDKGEDMETKQALPWLNGLPTAPWVKKLEAEFPDVESIRGEVITHERIEKILKVSRESEPNRYKTIIDSWRRKVERETGVVIDGRAADVVGVGLRVLTHGEQISFSVSEGKKARRRIRRQHVTAANTDEDKLTKEQKAIREHQMFSAAKLHALMAEIKKPKLPSPKDDLPQAAAVN